MRLLKFESHDSFSITRDLLDELPPYAILSHTWEADEEEATFQDIVKGSGKDKAGYRKIRFCGQQATRDGLHYFWVDSCCIDKSNSTELSEAINSMFNWYNKAAKCYVYLADVSTSGGSQASQSPERTWNHSFRNSRWFTRGWTLQELLAPAEVEFFTHDGMKLGSKRSLEQQIHETTGIPIQALKGSPLSNFSVDERLSWAEKRQTKREEDAAYSLLGLFNLHIPLIYGEGRSNAMSRLMHELERRRKADAYMNPFARTSRWPWLATTSEEIRRWFFGGLGVWKPSTITDSSRVVSPEPAHHHSPRSITQKGSKFQGPITVSGGTVFQGNYVGLGPGMLEGSR